MKQDRLHIMEKIIEVPKIMWTMSTNQMDKLKYEKFTKYKWKELAINPSTLNKVLGNKTLKKPLLVTLSMERELVSGILDKTKVNNKNNVTRTAAYLDFFLHNSSVHWSFLAHMVSRNAGWNMTDLKGSLLYGLMSKEKMKAFYLFLETANAIIFRDAYPQLLLYEESKRTDKNLFHLLPLFGVSSFMLPFWYDFFETGNSKLLTMALIVNEQHVIDKTVVHKEQFKKEVFESWQYQVQEVFQLTHVLFPYKIKVGNIRLAGMKVKEFEKVEERILVGKQLYSILFGIPMIFNKALDFSRSIPHTGSRSDFWRNTFTKRKDKMESKWHSCKKNAYPFIYSPTLKKAWRDMEFNQLLPEDWYNNNEDLKYFFHPIKTPSSFDVTGNYCRDLIQMSMVHDVKKSFY